MRSAGKSGFCRIRSIGEELQPDSAVSGLDAKAAYSRMRSGAGAMPDAIVSAQESAAPCSLAQQFLFSSTLTALFGGLAVEMFLARNRVSFGLVDGSIAVFWWRINGVELQFLGG